MIPDPNNLNPKLSGSQRDYIKAVAESVTKLAIKELRDEFVALLRKSNEPHTTDDKVETLIRRLDSIEARYKEDDKFTLTSAKIQALMKEKGIK